MTVIVYAIPLVGAVLMQPRLIDWSKVVFTFARNDHLYVIGIDVPEPPRRRAAETG